jgi:toxin YoeB
MIFTIDYLDEARDHIATLKRSEPQAYKKLYTLLPELENHPTSGTGRPKPLRGDKSGTWSRRIDKKHRLVYRIEEEKVVILVLSAMGHYEDK